MKKQLSIVLLAITMVLVSCGSADFSQVKEGMSKEEVLKLVGEPSSSISMFGSTVMTYQSHVVTLENDKVLKCFTKEEYSKQIDEALEDDDDADIDSSGLDDLDSDFDDEKSDHRGGNG